MKESAELIRALNEIEQEKGIDKEIIFEAIETSLITACKKNFGQRQNVRVYMDRKTGVVKVFAQKIVCEEVEDSMVEISVSDAREYNGTFQVGDICDIEVTPKDFGRIAAQTAKQVVLQKIREAEREIVYNEYITKEKDIVNAIVVRRDRKNIIVKIDKIEAVLLPSEQIKGEKYTFNERIKVYVLEVKKTSKGPVINVSRTHPELVKRLFEERVSEVHNGEVELKSIAREAGSRTKIAVYSENPDIDCVGACVGANGMRVNAIVDELKGEKIDIINWSTDPKEFISQALSPAKVLSVTVDEENKTSVCVVPFDQLSLAIGKEGQNARLAVKLTDYKIDIKAEGQEDVGTTDND